ncbi:hypothetical protein Bca4012_082394 [Brassica carinata]|uniref:Uncharacterized protein n=1 Tax=Brassica carinata TaxID=52824 RepID=A0A8X7VCC2_BRACI|nr:hypothetical protein Bca52824_028268 [Brassica carinata]
MWCSRSKPCPEKMKRSMCEDQISRLLELVTTKEKTQRLTDHTTPVVATRRRHRGEALMEAWPPLTSSKVVMKMDKRDLVQTLRLRNAVAASSVCVWRFT